KRRAHTYKAEQRLTSFVAEHPLSGARCKREAVTAKVEPFASSGGFQHAQERRKPVFKFNSKVMDITDAQVIHRLVHPDVFRKLRLKSVQLVGDVLHCCPEQGGAYEVTQIVTTDGGIERK